jgi:hypothetical protein
MNRCVELNIKIEFKRNLYQNGILIFVFQFFFFRHWQYSFNFTLKSNRHLITSIVMTIFHTNSFKICNKEKTMFLKIAAFP